MDLKLIPLKKQADISELDISICIICQKSQTAKLTSIENGRTTITEAANIRNDILLRSLQGRKVEKNFKYHMINACYKSYTMKKTLDLIMVGFLNFPFTSSSFFLMFLIFFICFLLLHSFPSILQLKSKKR